MKKQAQPTQKTIHPRAALANRMALGFPFLTDADKTELAALPAAERSLVAGMIVERVMSDASGSLEKIKQFLKAAEKAAPKAMSQVPRSAARKPAARKPATVARKGAR